MPSSLQHELRQATPFSTPEVEAVLSVIRTAGRFEAQIAEVLRPYDLTPTQYNVLRILRGGASAGLCRYEIAERLLTPGPDVTRLLDRLDEHGLTRRERDPEDRRQVRAQITPRGLVLLTELDDVLTALHRRQVGHLGADRLRTLSALLADAREG